MAFGTIIVKDSNGNIRRFNPDFDISQYITRDEVTQIVNDIVIPVSLKEISGELETADNVSNLIIRYKNTDDTTGFIAVDMNDILPTAVIDKISEINDANVKTINPSIQEINDVPTLLLEIVYQDNASITKSVPLSNIINAVLDNIPEFQPASETENGSAGIIPAPTSEQADSILTGSGWKTASELGIATDLSNSSFECVTTESKQLFEFGLNFITENGFIFDNPQKITVNLKSNEIWTSTYEVNSTETITGCSLIYPYSFILPDRITENVEYYQDVECWKNEKISNHYTVLFSTGYSVDILISDAENNEYSIDISVYAPKAESPKLFYVDVDGTLARYYVNMSDTETKRYDINASTISIYPRVTPTTQLYLNEDISEITPEELVEGSIFSNNYLGVYFERSSTGIVLTGKFINTENWPLELSNSVLHLVQETSDGTTITTDIGMSCLTENIKDSINEVKTELENEKQSRMDSDLLLNNLIGGGNVVHISGEETITGIKSFDKNIFGKSIELENGVINVSDGNIFTKTVEDDIEFTFTGVPEGRFAVFTLMITNGGTHEVTFPDNIVWSTDNLSLSEDNTDILTFFTPDGGLTWYNNDSLESAKKEIALLNEEPNEFNTDHLDVDSIILQEEYTSDDNNSSYIPNNSNNPEVQLIQNNFFDVVNNENETFDVSEAIYFTKTIEADCSLSFINVPEDKACTVKVMIINGGSYTITWDSSIHWKNDTVPSLEQEGTNILTFTTFDGGLNWFAIQAF